MFRSGLKTLNVSLHRRTAVDHIRETAEQPAYEAGLGYRNIYDDVRANEEFWPKL
jgi:hypothetical protein